MNPRQERQYYEILDIAFSYGFTVISDEYKGNKDHMEFECPKGHQRITSSNNYRRFPDSCYECSRLVHGINLKIDHPELVDEWHPDNGPMESYSSGSSKKVKWVCSKNPCGCHIWEAYITDRTRKQNMGTNDSRNRNPTGCPYCSCRKLCDHNNLTITHPMLIPYWHPENEPMKNFTHGSVKKVLWICPKNSNHIWKTSPNQITRHIDLCNSKCPFCEKNKPWKHNNLLTSHPELGIEWHPDNKDIEIYSVGSHEKVLWICPKNNKHIWKAQIKNRTRKQNPSGCPYCCCVGHSKEALKWIKTIEDENCIQIRSAASNNGEFKIPIGKGKFYKVDGYHEDTQTIYEYHGDYWHGNPLIYDPEDVNEVNGQTYGELYKKTIEREDYIKSLGYNLVVKWQTPVDYIEIPYID